MSSRLAPCPYYSHCGGCDLQQLEYSEQLERKKKQVSQLMNFPDVKVFSGEEFNYRNRMEFLFFTMGLGLRDKNNKKVVDVSNCLIAREEINKLILEVRGLFPKGEVIIRTTKTEDAIVFLAKENIDVEKIRQFSNTTTAKNVLIFDEEEQETIVIKGKEFLRVDILGKGFNFPAAGFFQNNSVVAEKMVDYVQGLLKKYPTSNGQLLDLYGGVGLFGISCADMFEKVGVVENVPPAIVAAKRNIVENGVNNVEAFCYDAKQLSRVKLTTPLYVITDPPRVGMDEKVIAELRRLKPEVIVYISCNPEQLAKDIKKFKEYKLKSVALFDMFPQTKHGEVVAELTKSNP